jgi:peptidoglycan/xylan/chitin deacetylase (PgdA/CDA1 family)
VGRVACGLLALTFDDGPDVRGTPAVLAALDEAGVTATFFVLGERVAVEPMLLERVLAAGHDVQVHGYGHLRHPYTPQDEVEHDIDRALEVLRTNGVEPTRWRIPWGHLADYTAEVAATRHLEIVGWTTDTHDWRGDSAGEMLAGLNLEHGGIVLAHDGVGSGARRVDASETARLVGPLVREARANGLKPGPLLGDWPVTLPLGNPDFG